MKHRNQKVAVKEVGELVSLLSKEGDAGLYVSSGGFTSDARIEIRRSPKHLEKIDLNNLILLWDDQALLTSSVEEGLVTTGRG